MRLAPYSAHLVQHVQRQRSRIGIGEQCRHAAHDQCGRSGGCDVEAEGCSPSRFVLDGRDIQGLGSEVDRHQQRLHRDRAPVECGFELLVHDAFVRGMHVDDDQSAAVFGEDVDAGELCQRKTEWMFVAGRGNAGAGAGCGSVAVSVAGCGANSAA